MVKKQNYGQEEEYKSVQWLYFGLMADKKGVPVQSGEHRLVCRMYSKGQDTSDLLFRQIAI